MSARDELAQIIDDRWHGYGYNPQGAADAILAAGYVKGEMFTHIHWHDLESHARSFNEGYEAAVTQGLADDPSLADDWLQEKIRQAKEEAFEQGQKSGMRHADRLVAAARIGKPELPGPLSPNPYRLKGDGK